MNKKDIKRALQEVTECYEDFTGCVDQFLRNVEREGAVTTDPDTGRNTIFEDTDEEVIANAQDCLSDLKTALDEVIQAMKKEAIKS